MIVLLVSVTGGVVVIIDVLGKSAISVKHPT